jgi:hypothetical protein
VPGGRNRGARYARRHHNLELFIRHMRFVNALVRAFEKMVSIERFKGVLADYD